MWVGAVCALIGALTLAGWYAHVHFLETLGTARVPMRPLTALGITLGGAALTMRALMRAPRASHVLAALVVTSGLLGLIDRLRPSLHVAPRFATRVLGISGASNLQPIAPATAVCLVVFGLAIVLTWRVPITRWASVCAFILAVPPAAILAAYIYDLHFTAPTDLNRMSLVTAVSFLGAASALWWLRGPNSALRILVSPGPGGSTARRLVPVGIVVPLILGWPRVVALRHNLFGPVVSVALGQVEAAILFATAVFWAAVSIDRTERRRREAAALSERRRDQLARAQRIARIGSWQRDLTTGQSEWSEEMYRILGYSIGSTDPSFQAVLDRADARDRPRLEAEVLRAIETCGSFATEYSICLPDGTRRSLRAEGTVEVADGRAVRMTGIAQDVTEQRHVEDALRESEDRYRIIIEGAAEGIWVSDAKGKTSLVNPRMAQMLGYSQQELASLPLSTFLAGDAHALLQTVDARRRAGLVDRYEVQLIRKDGTMLWVSVAANPLMSPSGDFLGSLAMISDISARKEAEATLQEAYEREREAVERLRAIDDMKDAFLTAVSHELRTPLTGVLGFAATLQQRDGALTPEERLAITERLVRNAERLNHLLSDLLDLDRLKRGLISPHRRHVSVDDLVRGIAEHVDLGGHQLTIDIDRRLDAYLDSPKVERIVENLLSNAVRHTNPGSRIWLSATASDGGFVIAVDDDGPGVDDQSKTVIFEPFETGSSRNSHSPGTGIGLSLVARFAQLHGGRCWIEDRVGGGCSFKVFLPRGEADAAHLDSGAA
jgi:PAS domain S-box-containing protein